MDVFRFLRCLTPSEPTTATTATTTADAEPPEPPDLVTALSADVLSIIAQLLPLPALSSLACTCRLAHSLLPDSLWLHHLTEKRALCMVAPPALASANSMSGPHWAFNAPTPADTSDEDDALREFATAILDAGGSCRARCAELWRRACVLCSRRATTSILYPYTGRGVCVECVIVRPAEAERWRRAQVVREHAAQERHFGAIRRRLEHELKGEACAALGLGAAATADAQLDLRFSSERDGRSLSALQRAGSDTVASLLVVLADDGASFGAFVPCRWERGDRFFGDSRTFLWAARPASAVDIHRSRAGCAPNFVHASETHGVGVGGDLGLFALAVSPDLVTARQLPSLTFGSLGGALSTSRVFVKDVQLWAVVVDPTVRRRGQSSWDRDAGSRSVLEPGENKLMLEFVGMEREIAMLRRHT